MLEGNGGPLPTSKTELFAKKVNCRKLFSINYCLKETHLRCGSVSESAFANQITEF